MLCLSLGCSSDESGSDGNAGSGGSAGTGAHDGGAVGGSGGVSDAARETGLAGHCSPGVLYTKSASWDHHLLQCPGSNPADYGLARTDLVFVHAITLPEPMTPGAPHALSVTVLSATPGMTVEFWGTSGKGCGQANERLYTGPFEVGVLCMELTATQPHDSLLLVVPEDVNWFIGDITACMNGACP